MEQAMETINSVQQTKVCTKCGKELPLSEFSKNAKSFDGHLSICKKCHAQAISEGRDRKRELPLPIKGVEGGNPDLARFTPRQLIEELHSRGFEGELSYTYRIKV